MGGPGTLQKFLLWDSRIMAGILIKAGKQNSRLERNKYFLKLPVGYPVEDVQEADKGTDLDVMLRIGVGSRTQRPEETLEHRAEGRGTAEDMKVNMNTGHLQKICREETANKWQNPEGHWYFRGKGKKQHQIAATFLGVERQEEKDDSAFMYYELRKRGYPSILPHSFL